MKEIWNLILFQPMTNGLIFFYNLLFSNLGLAILAMTVLIRGALTPVMAPAMKSSSKMKKIAPELESLKAKFKNQPQKLQQAQMALYKKHGVNPVAGCLPMIFQLLVLITLYQVFYQVLRANGDMISKLNEVLYPSLKLSGDVVLNTKFLYFDLTKPDLINLSFLPFPLPGLVLVLASLTQFLTSKMMVPANKLSKKISLQTKGKKDDLASSMQTQMMYLFPLMTLVIGFSFPSGLIIYWFVFSLFSLVQQYYTTGWGGLEPWLKKLKIIK
jgi:YidC/Oxa1 family membrane protein insertase